MKEVINAVKLHVHVKKVDIRDTIIGFIEEKVVIRIVPSSNGPLLKLMLILQ